MLKLTFDPCPCTYHGYLNALALLMPCFEGFSWNYYTQLPFPANSPVRN
jgi:hypothetical protein